MVMARPDLFQHICQIAGPSVEPVDPRDGWPGIARVQTAQGASTISLHVSNISTHARADYERRFQNPGNRTPVDASKGAVPILLGLGVVNGTEIVVAVSGATRVGREARFSILFNVAIMEEAVLTGWSEYQSGTGETIVAMHPRLLPAFVEALIHNVVLDPSSVSDAASASGLLEHEDNESSERTRVAVSRLVRRAAFGRDVCHAYEYKCAMCGIGLGLLEGAHIYPASAPGSTGRTWNGLALCRNDHRLFDRHKVWIDPAGKAISWHPEIIGQAKNEPIVANLLANTQPQIALPRLARDHPRAEMFHQRYQLIEALYDWAA